MSETTTLSTLVQVINMDLATILLGAVIILSIWLLWHLTHTRGHLETLGIPVDKPIGLLGSGPLDSHNHLLHEIPMKKFREFGTKTYGKYDGVVPVIMTMDPEIIKSVMVKNFDAFTDVFAKQGDKYTTLDLSGGETWRVLRKSLSPTFTSGKLKGMLEPLSDVADLLIQDVEKQVQNGKTKEIGIKDIFQDFALNSISRCAFGIDANESKDLHKELLNYGRSLVNALKMEGWIPTIISQIMHHFPYLETKITIWPAEFDKFWTLTQSIMAQRTEKNINMHDFVNRLMDMQQHYKKNPDDEDMKHITEDMIIAQGVIFFLAGYETTANTLCTTCYHLSKNPQVQERLFDEIQEVIDRHDGRIDHETINEMNYMEAVIQEDLRMSGPVSTHFRICNKDTEVVPGMFVKKGMRVEMPIYACHHNEEFFPEPEEFRPERFLKENAKDLVPYTFRPFGGGPRLCIGQRFSMVEMKLALAKLLSRYRLVATDNTGLNFKKGDLFLLSYDDIKIRLESRTQ